MNIVIRSSKTVRREVRPGCPLHCFTCSQSFSNHFHTAFPLPCNLPGIEFFREGNLPVPNLANAGVPPRVKRKIFLSAVERIFTDQPCPIAPATF